MKCTFQVFLISIGFVFFACSSPNEAPPHDSLKFTSDSLQISSFFAAALVSDSPQLFIDSAKVTVEKSKFYDAAQDLFLAQLSTFQLKRGEFENAMATANEGIAFNLNKEQSKQAKFHNIQGHVFSFTKDNTSAIASFKKALALFEKSGDSLNIAYINNNIANIFFSLTDYSTAYKHSKVAYDIIKKYPDNMYYGSILSVLAISEAFVNKIDEAKEHAQLAMRLTENTPNIVPYALSLYAMGDIAVSQDSLILANDFYQRSLTICETYNLLPYILINKTALLNVSVRTSQFQDGIDYGLSALELSSITQNENIQLSIYKNLSKAYHGLGLEKKAFENLETAYQLKEEISSKENKSIIHDLLIQYEAEKKDKEISRNRIQILEDEATISRARFYISLLVVVFIIIGSILFFYIKNRKEQVLKLEKEKETEIVKANLQGEQRERQRLSRELHDGIASELLGIRLKAEENSLDQEWIKTLDSVHQEVRRISHNLSPFKIDQFGLVEALKIFCIENSNASTTIHFFSNVTHTLPSAPSQVVYRCAQELIQNALKHAKAGDIDVQLFLDKNIRLSVEDNGIGMNTQQEKAVTTKIKSQWGSTRMISEVHSDSNSENGTSISIEFNL